MIPAAQEQPWDQVGAAETAPRSPQTRVRSRRLPLEGRAVPWDRGWEVRFPLRAERVVLEKQVVATERVTVRRGQVTDTVHLNETVAREELRVDAAGEVAVSSDNETLRARPRE